MRFEKLGLDSVSFPVKMCPLVFVNACFTSVDGNWGSWQPWGECSASCGGGERTRIRLCNNPSPNSGGRACPGDASQLARCNAQACPGWTLVPCQVRFWCHSLYSQMSSACFTRRAAVGQRKHHREHQRHRVWHRSPQRECYRRQSWWQSDHGHRQ